MNGPEQFEIQQWKINNSTCNLTVRLSQASRVLPGVCCQPKFTEFCCSLAFVCRNVCLCGFVSFHATNHSSTAIFANLTHMKLNFRTHIAKIVNKAHQRCNILLRCFTHTSVSLLLKAYLIYVRPNVEYASVVWSPSCSSLITKLEKVQRCFTKRLSGLSKMSYPDRLKTLSLPTLEARTLTADLIFCYKIINGLVSLDPADFFLFFVIQRPEVISINL